MSDRIAIWWWRNSGHSACNDYRCGVARRCNCGFAPSLMSRLIRRAKKAMR